MIWKIQPCPVFWIPMPYTNQHLMELTEWQRSETANPVTIPLTDPDTGEDYQVEILDYLGPYPMSAIPGFLARDCVGRDMTGKLFELLLRKKKPEFAAAKTILFYQVNPINK